jgi:hypothetical protein
MHPRLLSSWPATHLTSAEPDEAAFIRAVYRWMFGGLLLTAAAAWWTISSPMMQQLILGTPGVFLMLLIAELLLVFALSAEVARLTPAAAAAIFFVYALFNGFTFSAIAFAYAHATIASAFVTAAAMFGVMSIAGMATRRDLASFGALLVMALIGIVIAAAVNLFLRADALSFAISVAAVLVFAGLTAWDTQKLKRMALWSEPGATPLVITGALALYLDFLNLFLVLLQLFGRRERR